MGTLECMINEFADNLKNDGFSDEEIREGFYEYCYTNYQETYKSGYMNEEKASLALFSNLFGDICDKGSSLLFYTAGNQVVDGKLYCYCIFCGKRICATLTPFVMRLTL